MNTSKTPLSDSAEIIDHDSFYGHFCGGDPRDFSPDPECCTETEMRNHKKACALWDEMIARGEKPTPESCPSGWNADHTIHVLRAPYGIGVQSIEEPSGKVPIEFARAQELKIAEAKEAICQLCYAIEALPASEQQTALSIQAFNIYQSLSQP